MATANIHEVYPRKRTSLGVEVVYATNSQPTVHYVCYATSLSNTDVDAAIVAHIRQRKAAGKYYAGEPEPTTAERTITF